MDPAVAEPAEEGYWAAAPQASTPAATEPVKPIVETPEHEEYWSAASRATPAPSDESYWQSPPPAAPPAEPAVPVVAPAGNTIQAAPPPTQLEQLRNTIANSAIGTALENAAPRVADLLHLHPSETVNSPTYEQDQQQLIAPQYAARGAGKQSADLKPSAFSDVATGVGEAIGGQTTAPSLLALAAMSAPMKDIYTLFGATGSKLVPRLVSAGFSAQMLKGLYDKVGPFRDAIHRGDYATARQLAGQAIVEAPLATATALHALHGRPKTAAVGDAKEPVPAPQPTPEAQPLAKEPVTGREVLQPNATPAKLNKAAKQEAPALEDGLKRAVDPIPGARVDAVRPSKNPERIRQKIEEEGQPASTIPDYLASRVVVDSPAARTAAVSAIKAQFPTIRDVDQFNDGDEDFGYRVHKLQVNTPSGLTAEVHIVPKEVADINKDEHMNYKKARQADITGSDKQFDAAAKKAKDANDAAMEKFNARNAEEKPKYSHGSSQVNIEDESEAGKALNVSRDSIPDGDLAGKGKDVGGNHITVRYGLQGELTPKLREYIEGLKPFEAKVGTLDAFPPSESSDGAAPIHAKIESPELEKINAEIGNHAEFKKSDFDDYKPHATIAYVKPEAAQKYVGRADASGRKFPVKSIAISDREGNHTEIELKGKGGREESPEQEQPAVSQPATPATPKAGSYALLPDGSVGKVDYYNEGMNRGRMTTVDGRKLPTVRGADMTPLAEVKPGKEATGTPLEKELAERNKTEGPKLLAQYLKDNVYHGIPSVSTDAAKSLYPEYVADPTKTNSDVNQAAAAIADAAWRTLISRPPVEGKEIVSVLTGAPASGKTTMVRDGGAGNSIGINREAILQDLPYASKLVDDVINSGRVPEISLAYTRDPAENLRRAVARATESGRPVPIDYMAKAYVTVPKIISALAEKYGDKIKVDAWDTTENKPVTHKGTVQPAVEATGKYTEQTAREAMLDELRHLRTQGKVSEKLYEAFTGPSLAETAAGHPGQVDSEAGSGARGERKDADRGADAGRGPAESVRLDGTSDSDKHAGERSGKLAKEEVSERGLRSGERSSDDAAGVAGTGRTDGSGRLRTATDVRGPNEDGVLGARTEDVSGEGSEAQGPPKDREGASDSRSATPRAEEGAEASEKGKVNGNVSDERPKESVSTPEQSAASKPSDQGEGSLGVGSRSDDGSGDRLLLRGSGSSGEGEGTAGQVAEGKKGGVDGHVEVRTSDRRGTAQGGGDDGTAKLPSTDRGNIDRGTEATVSDEGRSAGAVDREGNKEGRTEPAGLQPGEVGRKKVLESIGRVKLSDLTTGKVTLDELAKRPTAKEVAATMRAKGKKVKTADEMKDGVAFKRGDDKDASADFYGEPAKNGNAPMVYIGGDIRHSINLLEPELAVGGRWSAATIRKETVDRVVQSLRDTDTPLAVKLADVIESHRDSHGSAILIAPSGAGDAEGEEQFHAAQARSKGFSKEVAEALQGLPEIEKSRAYLAKKGYSATSKVAVIEATAKSANADWAGAGLTQDEAAGLLAQFFDAVVKTSGPEALDEYPQIAEELQYTLDQARERHGRSEVLDASRSGTAPKEGAGEANGKAIEESGETRGSLQKRQDAGGSPGPDRSRALENPRGTLSRDNSGKVVFQRTEDEDALDRLTSKTKALDTKKQTLAEKLGKSANKSVTAVTENVSKAAELKDDILRNGKAMLQNLVKPREWTDYDALTGEFQAQEQKADLAMAEYAKEIKRVVPDKIRREAITNWIQANGDKDLLKERARTSQSKYRDGYKLAAELTPDEVAIAKGMRQYMNEQFDAGLKAGLDVHFANLYMSQIYEGDAKGLKSLINFGELAPNPAFIKKRVFQNYFEAEMAGEKPKDKDAAFLLTAYHDSFTKAVSSRAYIRSLLEGKAEDGRPLAILDTNGAYVQISPDQERYVITPKPRPDDMAKYRHVDHPALRNWKWDLSDKEAEEVNPKLFEDSTKALVKSGDLMLHPDIATRVQNILSKSAIQENAIGRAALAVSSSLKHTLLSFSGFHQTQETIHALGHKVNPLNMVKLDLRDQKQYDLASHGLLVADFSGQQAFSEGVSGGALVNYIPVIGDAMAAYQHYLFRDYIPRLKMTMALHALERNTVRYAGKLDRDQILRLTADQSNAAFGGQNQKMGGDLATNKTFQDITRLLLLAPDFLWSRMKFAGQALLPHGMEQRAALVRSALVMYAGARILNYILNDGDAKFDRKDAFTIVYKGKGYGVRSVPEDILHLIEDPRSFTYNRINPMTLKPAIEFITGRDAFGRQKSTGSQMEDFVKGIAPIPAQGYINNAETSPIQSILGAMGIQVTQYRTTAELNAHKARMRMIPDTPEGKDEEAESRLKLKMEKDLRAGKITPTDLWNKVKEGKLTPGEAGRAMKDARLTPLQKDFKALTMKDAMDVYAKATPAERETLKPELEAKRARTQKEKPRVMAMLNKKLDKLLEE